MSCPHTKTSVVFKQLTIFALNIFYLYPTGIFLTCHYLLPSKAHYEPLVKLNVCTTPLQTTDARPFDPSAEFTLSVAEQAQGYG